VSTSGLFQKGTDEGASDLDYLLAGGAEETGARARARDLPLRELPVTAIAPDSQQLRRLPHPDELNAREGDGDQTVVGLLANLRALGASLRASGQLQPVIVYAERDPAQPGVTHRLLHGQRRWTAAMLEGLPTLLAVEVPRPSEVERLQRQFDENERREDFTDMERAWAIMALREALASERGGEVPWTEVEQRLGLSDSRRRDLLRLLRLPEYGQELALRYRWAEWTLRPLHMAINAGEIDEDTANGILVSLAREGGEVTAPVVATAVASMHALQQATVRSALGELERLTEGEQAGAVDQRAAAQPQRPALVTRLQKARRGIEHVGAQMHGPVDAATRAALLAEAQTLMTSLEGLLQRLGTDLPEA
jgi:ParB/RepB/Spo0J family partition protein